MPVELAAAAHQPQPESQEARLAAIKARIDNAYACIVMELHMAGHKDAKHKQPEESWNSHFIVVDGCSVEVNVKVLDHRDTRWSSHKKLVCWVGRPHRARFVENAGGFNFKGIAKRVATMAKERRAQQAASNNRAATQAEGQGLANRINANHGVSSFRGVQFSNGMLRLSLNGMTEQQASVMLAAALECGLVKKGDN